MPTDVVHVGQQIVDIPVPGACGSFGFGGLHGFHPGQSSLQPSVRQIADIPVHGGGLQDLLPDQGSAASSSVLPEEQFPCVFSHFSPEKSAWVAGQVSG